MPDQTESGKGAFISVQKYLIHFFTARNDDSHSDSGMTPTGSASNLSDNGGVTKSSSAYEFEQRKMQKDVIEQGIDLFNRKPKLGLKFLNEKGLVGRSAQDIAAFFHKEERLDKAVVGDFLGDGDQ